MKRGDAVGAFGYWCNRRIRLATFKGGKMRPIPPRLSILTPANALMFKKCHRTKSALPPGWPRFVKSAVLRTISLAHYTIVAARAKTAEHFGAHPHRTFERERCTQELSLLREEMCIKDARMAQVPAHRRPRYGPTERLAILELKSVRGWSLAQTARRFQVTAATISSWQRRVDEGGPGTLLKLPRPVNQFPQLVAYLVRRLKILCPALGKRKLAATLARAGLHLSATTVSRMLRDDSPPPPSVPTPQLKKRRVVTARQPNHVWHADLTAMPIGGGFWCAWPPLALPQCWPFCWWVAVVVDHFSRRVMGVATFARQPTSESMLAFLGRTIARTGMTPKYLVCDRGCQFDCHGFRRWCRRHGIRPRYGAIGRHGSIAVIERCIRTLKELVGQLPLVPLRRKAFRHELDLVADWYNEHRPHETLGGRTPNEAYYRRFPAHRRPRHEPRSRWPRGSPCAKPWALTRGRPGAQLELEVKFHAGRRHLPVVTLKRVA